MKEIEIGENHNLPYGYYYRKPISTEPKYVKPDQEIAEELAGSMPLSEIAKTCDAVKEPVMEEKTMARVDVNWNRGKLIIDIYPITDVFPDVVKAMKYKFYTQPYIFRNKKFKDDFAHEKLDKIIYG